MCFMKYCHNFCEEETSPSEAMCLADVFLMEISMAPVNMQIIIFRIYRCYCDFMIRIAGFGFFIILLAIT